MRQTINHHSLLLNLFQMADKLKNVEYGLTLLDSIASAKQIPSSEEEVTDVHRNIDTKEEAGGSKGEGIIDEEGNRTFGLNARCKLIRHFLFNCIV